MREARGGGGCWENHKPVGFLRNTGTTCIDPNHKCTKSVFSVGSSSAHQRNWRADGGPLFLKLGIGFLRNTGMEPSLLCKIVDD